MVKITQLYLHCVSNSLCPCPQLSMTSDTGISKEEDDEEDDTMQNTVVLFSNTDKFVLLQVQLLLLRDIYNYPEAFAVPRITVFTFECNINRFIVNLFFHSYSHFLSSVLGYVCRVWQFWKGCRGAVVGLCSVCPVLPSVLCEQQSKENVIL